MPAYIYGVLVSVHVCVLCVSSAKDVDPVY